jgi:hypothetical protein
MSKQVILALLAPLLMPVFASATTVTYDFEVNGGPFFGTPAGPLSDVTADGTFSLDSSSLGSSSTDTLSSLSFTWNGTTFTAATANTGRLYNFNPSEVDLIFGDKCITGGCSENGANPNDWFVVLQFPALGQASFGGSFFYSDGTGNSYEGVVSATPAPAVPLPPAAWLMLSGLGVVGAAMRASTSARRRPLHGNSPSVAPVSTAVQIEVPGS